MIRYKKLFVGSVCNNQCVTCPNTGERTGLSLDAILGEMGEPEGAVDSLELVGGEPSIRQDLAGIVAQAKERGWRRVKMVTNARAFASPENVVAAMQAGVRVFEVKLCGPAPELHDALTQSQGSFVETVQGLANLKNLEKPAEIKTFVSVRVPISATSYVYVPTIVAFAVQLRVDRITLSLDDAQARMSEVAPALKAGIETGLVNSAWVQTEGVPLCLMDGYEHHVSETFGMDARARERREPCGACAYETCEGIWSDYLEAQGPTEFLTVLDSTYAERMKEAAADA